MFQTAELMQTLPKSEYKERVPVLRQELLMVQNALRSADFPVIVVLAGVDGAGKSETVNLLHEWMDSRWLISRHFGPVSDEERDRPAYWRYWRELPKRGRIGFYQSSWYSTPILDQVNGRADQAEFDRQLERIRRFERELAEDGALILKFWMHLSKDAQQKRLKFLEKHPLLHWRISKTDWENWRNYDAFIMAAERTMLKTSTGFAPWKIVEGYDERFRSIQVATMLKDAIQHQLRERKLLQAMDIEAAVVEESSAADIVKPITVLSCLNMNHALAKSTYKAQLQRQHGRLNRLQEQARDRGVSTIVVLEGWDAAGKGGAIRRVTHAVDSRDYQVIQIAAPTDEERAHHYLWRFWRHLPRAGRITIYDRSWYGRVLVERIEGYASEHEWQRAYTEINDFEEQLTEFGIAVVKFWIHITKDEQLERFKAREQTPYKAWKLTDDDWRNRERWEEYELAVNDAVERTSTHAAPWTLVEGNNKRYARVKIVKTVCDRLEEVLGPEDMKSQ